MRCVQFKIYDANLHRKKKKLLNFSLFLIFLFLVRVPEFGLFPDTGFSFFFHFIVYTGDVRYTDNTGQ